MAGAAVSVLTLGACTIGSDDSGEETSGTTTSQQGDTAGLGTGDAYSVEGALAELPAPEYEEFEVRTADLTAASTLSGLDRPTQPDPDEVLPWIGPLTGLPVEGSGQGEDADYAPVPVVLPEMTNPQQVRRIKDFDELTGWSLVDVDSYAEAVTAPKPVAVLTGDFDGSTLADLPKVKGEIRTVGEGPDHDHDLAKSSPVSPSGQPIRMVEDDERLLVSPSTDLADAWLRGPDETMADHPVAGALAKALDESDVVSAQITVRPDFRDAFASKPGDDAAAARQQAADSPTHPFDAVGLGWSAKGGEPVIVATYHFEDASAAADSVEELTKVFEDGKDMRGEALSTDVTVSEIDSDGPVVTAQLSPVRPNAQHTIIRRLTSIDVPFTHQ